ncbi:hypothetical protein A2V49_01235 [candidate division WWE3 bacterium RBG_19FT_COMBO_34_6]|uniref:DUF6602 domain-containing protein n=1 Tax=candidate division WWE3 bacterium RBG_19FT_COMBO_34_6 TaxID=1802612 RepID=A0A1F4UJT3_UNCKA|nr:MAG: hypothetical protein A2V49_01235 [candidate division WWE3 bacterium RBG_19FT_COMBO_34_6]
MEKPILYPYFKKSADVLSAEYSRSKEQSASANLGRNRESFCKEFLSKILPPKLSVKSGEIWDCENVKTGQLDLIILRDDAPSLHIGSDNIYLAEGVFGVIEIKSNLTREKFIECGQTLQNVSNLKINQGAMIVSGANLERPLRIVFAYEGATWETLLDEIKKNGWDDLFDLVCILSRGVLVNKGRLLKWDSQNNFMVIKGNASCLGYMFLYLVSYGSSFIGRSLSFTPYFEPFNSWSVG